MKGCRRFRGLGIREKIVIGKKLSMNWKARLLKQGSGKAIGYIRYFLKNNIFISLNLERYIINIYILDQS